MIYNFLNSIKANNLILFTIIFMLFISYSINNSNYSIKGVLGILISIFFAWFILDRDMSINNSKIDKKNFIVEKYPFFELIKEYDDLLFFYYDCEIFIKYDYINFKNSIISLSKMMNEFNLIIDYFNSNLPYKNISNHVDILNNEYNITLNLFKNIEFNIPNNVLKFYYEKCFILNEHLLKYVNFIYNLNNQNIKINGISNNKKNIYKGPLEYNFYHYY